SLRAEVARLPGFTRSVGIGPDAEALRRIRPLHHLSEIARKLRLPHFHAALQHLAPGPIYGDDVALAEAVAGHRHRACPGVDAQRACTAHARAPHPARDDGGMAGHAAPRGEDAGGGVHAVDVLGSGLEAD